MSVRLHAIETDITRLAVDAIVNAANTTLLAAAGSTAQSIAQRALNCSASANARGCATGDAKITRGYLLRRST